MSPQRDSLSLLETRQATSFEFLVPGWLPPRTDLVSYRWWSDGATVELHTVTRERRADNVTGRLTIQQWSGPRERESQIVPERDGFVARQVRTATWFYAAGDPDSWLGRVGDVNVLISTTFDPNQVEHVIAGLSE